MERRGNDRAEVARGVINESENNRLEFSPAGPISSHFLLPILLRQPLLNKPLKYTAEEENCTNGEPFTSIHT